LVCSISSKHVSGAEKTSLESGGLGSGGLFVGEYFSLESLLFEVVRNDEKEIVLEQVQIE